MCEMGTVPLTELGLLQSYKEGLINLFKAKIEEEELSEINSYQGKVCLQ